MLSENTNICPYSGHTTSEYSRQNVSSFRCYLERRCGDEGTTRLQQMPLRSQEFWRFKTAHNGHMFYLHFVLSDWTALHLIRKHSLSFRCNCSRVLFMQMTDKTYSWFRCIVFYLDRNRLCYQARTKSMWIWNKNTFTFQTHNKALLQEAITLTSLLFLLFLWLLITRSARKPHKRNNKKLWPSLFEFQVCNFHAADQSLFYGAIDASTVAHYSLLKHPW